MALGVSPTGVATGGSSNLATNPSDSVAISYTDDAQSRMTSAIYSTGLDFHYDYDPVGKVLIRTQVAAGIAVITSYTYNATTLGARVLCNWTWASFAASKMRPDERFAV